MTTTARTRTRRPAARPKVSLEKPPTRVLAGGLIWTAAEDGQPYASPIGFELALKHGVPAPSNRDRV